MLASYHNHTNWSDGRDDPATLVAAAAALGLGEVGISDHHVLHPEGRQYDWAIREGGLADYVAAVESCREASPIPVRLGVEVDWFPGHADAIAASLAPHAWDYVIGSVHEVDGWIVDGSPHAWAKLTPAERDVVHRRYWIAMASLAGSGLFDIAAHIDLTKKFDYYPTIDLTKEIDDALDAIAAAGLVVELNTAGWHKPCRDAYPTLDLLGRCHERGIATTLSADAHRSVHLLRDFEEGAERLRAAGYTQIARFEGRKRWMDGLHP